MVMLSGEAWCVAGSLTSERVRQLSTYFSISAPAPELGSRTFCQAQALVPKQLLPCPVPDRRANAHLLTSRASCGSPRPSYPGSPPRSILWGATKDLLSGHWLHIFFLRLPGNPSLLPMVRNDGLL